MNYVKQNTMNYRVQTNEIKFNNESMQKKV